MRETIKNAANSKPVIVFIDYANKAQKLQAIANELEVPFLKATTDAEMSIALSIID